ncbi:MAG: hypothetical protein HY720_18780 [Planctomycetes bacterium]|nr:hypothetical protein [Planctomycetota bacterium]
MGEGSAVKTAFQFLFYVFFTACLVFVFLQNNDTQRKVGELRDADDERKTTLMEILQLVKMGGMASAGGDQTAVYSAEDALKFGARIRVSYGNDPATIDPITGTDTTSQEFREFVCEYLAQRRVQNPEEWEANLAESWEQSEDGRTITVHLRKNAMWHRVRSPTRHIFEPEPFDAADVIFTWTIVQRNTHVKCDQLRPYLELFDRVEKLDDHTVVFHWKETYFKALDTVLNLFEIVPEHFFTADEDGMPLPGVEDITSAEFGRAFNEHWSNKEHLCGTGPYVLEKYDRQEGIVVKATNRDYYGKRAYLDRVLYYRVPDDNTSYLKYIGGELDARTMRAREYTGKFKDEPRLKNEELKVDLYDYPVYRFIGWNLRKPLFQEKRVRQALTHGVNRKFFCEKIFHGLALPQDGPFFIKGSSNSPNVKPFEYDLDKARELLKEAGWADEDGNGVLEKRLGGEKTEFAFNLLIYADSPEFLAIAETIQADYRKLGIKMDVSPVKWEVMLPKVDNFDFDAYIMGWGLDFLPDPAQLWHSKYADTKGSSNAVGWKDPKTDELIDKIQRTLDPAERQKLYWEFHENLYEHQPYTWLFYDQFIASWDARYEGIEFFDTGIRPSRDRREWYLPIAKR